MNSKTAQPSPPKQQVDISKLSEEEKLIFQKYGKLPTKKDMVSHKLKERKFFDSGDYALYKAGKTAGPGNVGSVIPSPDMIPHSNPGTNHQPSHPHTITSIQPLSSTSTTPTSPHNITNIKSSENQ